MKKFFKPRLIKIAALLVGGAAIFIASAAYENNSWKSNNSLRAASTDIDWHRNICIKELEIVEIDSYVHLNTVRDPETDEKVMKFVFDADGQTNLICYAAENWASLEISKMKKKLGI